MTDKDKLRLQQLKDMVVLLKYIAKGESTINEQSETNYIIELLENKINNIKTK